MAALTSPDGVRLTYKLEGNGPSLLLHLGAGCDAELWRVTGYVEALSQSYRCILFDHRGHGESERPAGRGAYHIDRFGADVLALLDHLEIERTAFWGYSLGGSVGIKVAEEHPERVAALVVSGAVGSSTPEETATVASRRIAEHREFGWERLIARFDEQERHSFPEWMKERIRATDIQQFIGFWEALPDWGWDEYETLPRVTTPTLFLTGELEDPEDETGMAASRMPHGSRVRLAGKGHINAFIESQLVLPAALEFLRRYHPA